MSPEQREIVRLRLEKAKETLEEARVLCNAQAWNGAVNRLYYACFYAVNALLYTQDLHSSKHTGVEGLFNKHFVHPGAVSKEAGRTYKTLFRRRMQFDYEDILRAEREDVLNWLEGASHFIEELTSIVEQKDQSNLT
ncbi:MAG: HEPN domain-containing protein [Candidatus Hydrogenedentota bacterium]